MRRGQSAGSAPEFLLDDSGWVLGTVKYAASVSKRAPSTIRDRSAKTPPRACDVRTGALYWDLAELGVELANVRQHPHRRSKPVAGGNFGTRHGASRPVT